MIDMKFVLAGKAVFTVDNGRGEHFTFKISGASNNVYFAHVLSRGYDNTYMGLLDVAELKVIKGKKGIDSNSKSVKVLEWSLRVINGISNIPDTYSIMHENACGKCGKPLTDPESIKTGLGPTCRKY